MNRLFLLATHFILFLGQVSAQTTDTATVEKRRTKEIAIGLTGGAGIFSVRDRVISNYLYKGNYTPIGIHLENRSSTSKMAVSLVFLNKPTLTTNTNEGFHYKGDLGETFPDQTDGYDFSTLKTRSYSLGISDVFLLRKTENKFVRTYLGFDFSLQNLSKKFLQFEYVNEIRDRVYSLSPMASFETNFSERHRFEYSLSVPLVNHVKRTLYNSESDPATVSKQKLTSFGSLFGFDSRLSYQWRMARWFSLRAVYSFKYLQIKFPEKEQWAQNQLVVGCYFHF
jgi:hypothetical protein